jgi:hypothetical protein
MRHSYELFTIIMRSCAAGEILAIIILLVKIERFMNDALEVIMQLEHMQYGIIRDLLGFRSCEILQKINSTQSKERVSQPLFQNSHIVMESIPLQAFRVFEPVKMTHAFWSA